MRRCRFIEVKLVNVLVYLARLDFIDGPAETVETRDILLQVRDDTHSFFCLFFKTAEDQVLVGVIKLVPIFYLVEVGEELSFRTVAKIGLLVTLESLLRLLARSS